MKYADVRTSAWRVELTRVVLVLAFVALGVRAAHLSIFDQRGAARGDAQTLRTLTLPPERGAIVDREGAELALSVDAPSIYAIPDRLEGARATARALARVLRIDANRLARRLESARGFQFVARWVTAEQAAKVGALALPGVGIVKEPRRIYPHRILAAPILGFANIDGKGVRGVEQQEDAWLRGTTRRLPMERDGSGRLMLVSGGSTWGTAGGDVALTLDATLQADAERALAEAIAVSGARGGIVLTLDPHSGEILTLAEAPSFDPNRFRTLDYDSTRAPAILDAVEPGSTLKAFLIAAALEKGVLSADELVDCENGSFQVPGKRIHDHKPHGLLDPAGILRVSSNIGAVKVANDLGRSAHFEMLRRFGFGEPTGMPFPDESAGVLRPWRRWRPVDHATIAFGQGVSVTALQLAAATAVLANGGEWVRPRLVAARRAAGRPWQRTHRQRVRRVVSRETARATRAMLETVVSEDGTGRRAALAGVRVAGKTGTSQKWDADAGTYSMDRFHAWFVGMAPADDPKLVILTQLDEPRRPMHTGGAVAAPLFARVAATQLARFGIFPDGPAPEAQTRIVAHPEPIPAVSAAAPPVRDPKPTPAPAAAAKQPAPHPESRPAPARQVAAAAAPARPLHIDVFGDRVLLPDFRGFTVAEVMRITASRGLRVKVTGHGRAIRQDPPPGTVVPARGGSILVEFGERGGADGDGGQTG